MNPPVQGQVALDSVTKERIAKISIYKEQMKFSAGHFTIFSTTERENLHGHNFTVKAAFHLKVLENGLGCDYRIFKNTIEHLCNTLNETFLLPTQKVLI